jgi:hypothetical protein
MAAVVIGKIKSGKTKRVYEVKWNSNNNDTYINYAGGTLIGKLPSPASALIQAEHFLRLK